MLIKRKNKKLYIIGIFIILFSIGISSIPFFIENNENMKEEEKIEEFLKIDKIEKIQNIDEVKEIKEVKVNNYNMVIEIPKIDLYKGLYNLDSKYNNVAYNIEILKESDMPNVTNGNFILASHNGNSSVSYFEKLTNLNLFDDVYIYYENVKYNYQITDFYEVNKNGIIEIKREHDETVIVLITCKKNTKDKQLVYVGNLINKENY
ncbi:MAG: sortase [Bacilli bacterium]